MPTVLQTKRTLRSRWSHAVIRSIWGRMSGLNRVPILMYHRVHPEPNVLSVSPENFEAQIRFIKEYCQPISLSELVRRLQTSGSLPAGAVVVTFDDGYLDNYTHAFPVLMRYQVPATFFVTAGLIGERRYFWWDRVRLGLKDFMEVGRAWPAIAPFLERGSRDSQVAVVTEALKLLPTEDARELIERICYPIAPEEPVTMSWEDLRDLSGAGMEIGSHTVTHPILSRQTPEEAAWEVRHSKEIIERRLGMPIAHFAYPNGRPCDFHPSLIRTLEAVGYASACSTVEGRVSPQSSRYSLERVGMYQDAGLPQFITKLLGIR